MVNYYIYAKDFSGSIADVQYYHTNGMKSLIQFKSDVERIKNDLLDAGEPPTESKIIYLHWGDRCYEVDEDIIVTSYNELASGYMGTEPKTIIEWIKENHDTSGKNKIRLLYIITDGMINSVDAEKCFDLNVDMFYETVVFHAFNELLWQIDLSVAASYFKNRCMVYQNYELFDNVNISEKFGYDKITIDNFLSERDNLKSYIKLKYIQKFKSDRNALREIDKLKKFRDRLFIELSSKDQKSEVILDTKDKDVFLREFVKTNWYKSLTAPDQSLKVEIEKSISTLINYIVSDSKSYSFDALKFDTKFDNPIQEEPIVDVDFTAEQEIEFPDIILNDDKGIPVIILTECNLLDKIIFHKTRSSAEVTPASFNKFKSAMECPLFLVKDPDISESIGYFYTLNVYKQFLASSIKTEPRTRRPFHGALVLTDTDEFDDYNDYILAATYFNFKKIQYNTGLFYYVLFKNCENKKWMDENVVDQFKKYVMRRISTTVCKVGLSSLPLDPQEKTLLPTALWYCVELSSRIFKDDPQKFMHERLRMHYGVADCMIEILKYLNYDLDIDTIEKRRDLIRLVMIFKKMTTSKEKVYFLLKKIFKNDNGFLVSEIEKPYNLKLLNYLKLHHKEMLRDDIIQEQVHLNDFVHMMHYVGDLNKSQDEKTYEICEKTFRPYFTIDQNTSYYTELFKATNKVIINNDDDKDKIKITFEPIDSISFDKILSLYKLFINCVTDHEKYPTLPEYIEYILKKKKFKGELVTIFPPTVYLSVKKVHSRYQNIANKVDVKEFMRVGKRYVNRLERIQAEEKLNYKFYSDIEKFIAKEESKVCLKKTL